MNIRLASLPRRLLSLVVLGLALGSSGAALAKSYTIYLKGTSRTPSACATGVINFDKTVVGSHPLTGVSVTLGVGNANPCLGLTLSGTPATFSGNLNVEVQNVTTSDGQFQGPNVVGLSGTLVNAADPLQELRFSVVPPVVNGSPTPRLEVVQNNVVQVTGFHYLFGTNEIPEPGALWLVLTALAATLALRFRRRGAVVRATAP